jgi:hypothetical protein
MRRKPELALATFVMLALASWLVADERPPYRLLGDRVGLIVGSDWVNIRQLERVVAFQVPNPADEGTPHSANVAVVVHPEVTGSFENRVREASAGVSVIVRLPETASDRDALLLSRGQQGSTPYIVVDRVARRAGLDVHVRAAWPILEATTQDWHLRFFSEVNRLMSELTVDGSSIGSMGTIVERLVEDEGETMRVVELESEPGGSTPVTAAPER